MLTLCGWDLQLEVDKVLCQSESWFLGSATDGLGQRWLVQHRRVPETPVWVCAEVSARMLEEVEAGRAEARDVFRHSLTGTVEIVSADHRGGLLRDRCVPCAELPDGLIAPGPAAGADQAGPFAVAPPAPRDCAVGLWLAGPARPSGPPSRPPTGSAGTRRRRVLARGATGSS